MLNLTKYKSSHERNTQKNGIAMALAASGGGYRAANIIGRDVKLEKLHSNQLHGNLLQQIDYYSTVSGGGFGVGYYFAQLDNYLASHSTAAQFSLVNR